MMAQIDAGGYLIEFYFQTKLRLNLMAVSIDIILGTGAITTQDE